jgi:cell division protein FtsB
LIGGVVLALAEDEGWTAANWTTLLGAVFAVVSAAVTGLLAYRASVRSNKDKIDADERAAERAEDQRRRELQDETIAALRAHLEGIITRLTEEVEFARKETARLRDQVNQEQSVSDTLRSRVRDLEDRIHEMGQTIADLRRQLIAEEAADALNMSMPGRPEESS